MVQKINIFMSYDDSDTKEELGNFLRFLNDTYVDKGIFFKLHTEEEGELKKIVDESDLFIMLINKKVNGRELFDEALKHFYEVDNPKIVPYFKESEKYSKSAQEFMNYLGDEIGHFYKVYNHIDSLKLGLLTHIKNFGFEDLTIKDNMVELDGKQVLKIDNIDMFLNNDDLTSLKEQYASSEEEYEQVKVKYLKDKKGYEKEYEEISEKRETVQLQITNLENRLLDFIKNISYKKASKRMIESQKLMEQGYREKALQMLDDDELFAEIKENIAKNNTEALKVNGNELWLKIKNPYVKKYRMQYWEKLYDIHQNYVEVDQAIPIYYAEFLISKGNYKTAFEVINRPQKYQIPIEDILAFRSVWMDIYAYYNEYDKASEESKKFIANLNESPRDEYVKKKYQMELYIKLGILKYNFAHFEEAKEDLKKARNCCDSLIKSGKINNPNELNWFVKRYVLLSEYLIKVGYDFDAQENIYYVLQQNKIIDAPVEIFKKGVPKGIHMYRYSETYIENVRTTHKLQVLCYMIKREYQLAIDYMTKDKVADWGIPIKLFDESSNYCYYIEDKQGEAEMYKLLGICYYNILESSEARKCFDKTIEIYEQLILEDPKKYVVEVSAAVTFAFICCSNKLYYLKKIFSHNKNVGYWYAGSKKKTFELIKKKISKELELL